jgi:hypothetical protein
VNPSRLLTGLLCVSLGCTPMLTMAQSSSSSTSSVEAGPCLSAAQQAMAKQQRLFRVTLLGRPEAREATLSTVWYDRRGQAWMKTSPGRWQSVGDGPTSRGDAEMDAEVETDPGWETPFREGIFSAPSKLTSELIPPALQGLRALQCRLRAVCRSVSLSLTSDAPERLRGEVDAGCLPVETYGLNKLPQCALALKATDRAAAEALTTCQGIADDLLAHEAQALRLIVAYDASTRALWQITGMLQQVIDAFRSPILSPLQHLSSLLQHLQQLPCTTGACAR